ncbi:MAG: hypothetical protein MUO19_08765 [Dehalococcoidales bacterium]|nr:hypothetical protein [Dehalococcoidales bacterium]
MRLPGLESVHARLLTLPDNIIVHSGHGRETIIGEERRENHSLTGSSHRFS